MSAAPGQLAWRCRRGVKELDLILGAWLERHYAQASASDRALFERLLELPDPELAGYLLNDAHQGFSCCCFTQMV